MTTPYEAHLREEDLKDELGAAQVEIGRLRTEVERLREANAKETDAHVIALGKEAHQRQVVEKERDRANLDAKTAGEMMFVANRAAARLRKERDAALADRKEFAALQLQALHRRSWQNGVVSLDIEIERRTAELRAPTAPAAAEAKDDAMPGPSTMRDVAKWPAPKLCNAGVFLNGYEHSCDLPSGHEPPHSVRFIDANGVPQKAKPQQAPAVEPDVLWLPKLNGCIDLLNSDSAIPRKLISALLWIRDGLVEALDRRERKL